MLTNFDDIQKLGKDNMDTCMKQFGTVSKGWQAIATEVADYSKKSFERPNSFRGSSAWNASSTRRIERRGQSPRTAVRERFPRIKKSRSGGFPTAGGS